MLTRKIVWNAIGDTRLHVTVEEHISDLLQREKNALGEKTAITAERDRLLGEVQRLNAVYKSESAQARKYKDEHSRALARIEELNAKLVHTQGEARQCAIKLDEMERQLAFVSKKREEVQALLESRTADLRDAQAFLSMTDEVPDTKVLDIVRQLNAAIFQTASNITDEDSLSYGETRPSTDSDTLKKWLGAPLLVLIRSVDPDFLSIVIQTALQAGISQYVANLAGSWDLGAFEECGKVFKEVYEDIRDHGTPVKRFGCGAVLMCA